MKTMYATRDFKDAGTGRSFARGEPMTDVDEGTVGNYEAAKLVTDENPNPVAAPEQVVEAAPVAPTESQADAATASDEFAPAASSEPAEGEAPQAAAEPQAEAAPYADAEPKSTRRRKAADAD